MSGDRLSDRVSALEELQKKPLRQIQYETALTWAARAWAARQLANAAATSNSVHEAYRLSHDAVEYEHEAIEHAALCGDDAALAEVREVMYGP